MDMKKSVSRAIAWLPALLAGGSAAVFSDGDPIQRLGNAIGFGLFVPLFVAVVVIFWAAIVARMQGSAFPDVRIEFSNPIFLGALLACVSLWLLNGVLARGHMQDVARCVESALSTQGRNPVHAVVLECDRSINKSNADGVVIGL